MYLICCPSIHIHSMIESLAGIHVNSVGLPMLELEFDEQNLHFLKNNIEQFDYVIIPSPSVIDYTKDIITNSIRPIFVTVGISSRDKISKINNRPVLCPEINSGGLALFNETIKKLNLVDKMVLVVKGAGGSDDLYVQMAKHNIKWTTLEIYKRVLHEIEPDYLKKMLLIQGVRGIIVTTGSLVDWLFSQAQKAKCLDILCNSLFITIHPRIVKKLKAKGALIVLMTAHADKNSVVELIKELDDNN